MDAIAPGSLRRVLVIGADDAAHTVAARDALSPDGMLICMEPDETRADAARRVFAAAGLGARAAVIGGEPARLLYKLAGPFDAIFCGARYLTMRDRLERLLASEGRLVAEPD